MTWTHGTGKAYHPPSDPPSPLGSEHSSSLSVDQQKRLLVDLFGSGEDDEDGEEEDEEEDKEEEEEDKEEEEEEARDESEAREGRAGEADDGEEEDEDSDYSESHNTVLTVCDLSCSQPPRL